MALIELAEKASGIRPAELYTDTDERGKTLFIVGFGDYGIAGSKITFTDGKRRAVTNQVDEAGPRKIFLRFEKPPGGTEFEGVGGAGDSGGPALLQDGDRTYIAGVSSGSMNGKPRQYGVIDVFTRISSYEDWIRQNMKPESKIVASKMDGNCRWSILCNWARFSLKMRSGV